MATPLVKPHAERFCAAGTLAEWATEHSNMGGRSAKVTHAKDLVNDFGAPLKVAKRAATQPDMARPHCLFAAEKYAELKRANPERTFNRKQYAKQHAKFCADFKRAPDIVKEEFRMKAMTPGHDLGNFNDRGQNRTDIPKE